jgi:transposase
MMGRPKSEQGQLFYQFNLADAVPYDHLVRRIGAALDLTWLRSELASHYSLMGRPSIDPELMIRMLVVGYVFAIRSERLLCREVQVNLAYRWFCRLGIEDAIPDHSAFSRVRNERFREGGTLRHFGTIRLFSWKNQQIRRFRGIHCGLQSGLHFECRNPVFRSMRSMWPGPIASARLAFASSLIRSVIRGVPGWASEASGAAGVTGPGVLCPPLFVASLRLPTPTTVRRDVGFPTTPRRSR